MSSAFAGWLKFLFAGDFLTVFVWTPFWNSNFSIYVFVGGWSGFLIKSALYFLLIVEFYCLTHFVLWRFTSRKKCYYDRSNNFSTNLLVRETSKNIQYKNGRKTIVKILNLLKLIDVYRYRNIDTDALKCKEIYKIYHFGGGTTGKLVDAKRLDQCRYFYVFERKLDTYFLLPKQTVIEENICGIIKILVSYKFGSAVVLDAFTGILRFYKQCLLTYLSREFIEFQAIH